MEGEPSAVSRKMNSLIGNCVQAWEYFPKLVDTISEGQIL